MSGLNPNYQTSNYQNIGSSEQCNNYQPDLQTGKSCGPVSNFVATIADNGIPSDNIIKVNITWSYPSNIDTTEIPPQNYTISWNTDISNNERIVSPLVNGNLLSFDFQVNKTELEGAKILNVFIQANCLNNKTSNKLKSNDVNIQCLSPYELTITNLSNNEYELKWKANNTNSFKLQWSENGGVFNDLSTNINAPIGTAIAITPNTINVSGFTQIIKILPKTGNTNYSFKVQNTKTECNSLGLFSNPSNLSIQGCNPILGLTANGLNFNTCEEYRMDLNYSLGDTEKVDLYYFDNTNQNNTQWGCQNFDATKGIKIGSITNNGNITEDIPSEIKIQLIQNSPTQKIKLILQNYTLQSKLINLVLKGSCSGSDVGGCLETTNKPVCIPPKNIEIIETGHLTFEIKWNGYAPSGFLIDVLNENNGKIAGNVNPIGVSPTPTTPPHSLSTTINLPNNTPKGNYKFKVYSLGGDQCGLETITNVSEYAIYPDICNRNGNETPFDLYFGIYKIPEGNYIVIYDRNCFGDEVKGGQIDESKLLANNNTIFKPTATLPPNIGDYKVLTNGVSNFNSIDSPLMYDLNFPFIVYADRNGGGNINNKVQFIRGSENPVNINNQNNGFGISECSNAGINDTFTSSQNIMNLSIDIKKFKETYKNVTDDSSYNSNLTTSTCGKSMGSFMVNIINELNKDYGLLGLYSPTVSGFETGFICPNRKPDIFDIKNLNKLSNNQNQSLRTGNFHFRTFKVGSKLQKTYLGIRIKMNNSYELLYDDTGGIKDTLNRKTYNFNLYFFDNNGNRIAGSRYLKNIPYTNAFKCDYLNFASPILDFDKNCTSNRNGVNNVLGGFNYTIGSSGDQIYIFEIPNNNQDFNFIYKSGVKYPNNVLLFDNLDFSTDIGNKIDFELMNIDCDNVQPICE